MPMRNYKLEDYDVPAMMAKYDCDEKVGIALVFLTYAICFEGALKDHGDHGMVELNVPADIDTADVDKAYDIIVTKVWMPAMERAKAAKRASGAE